jgi:hypothetical protein
MINMDLAMGRNLSEITVKLIEQNHEAIEHMFKGIDQHVSELGYKGVVDYIEIIEYRLQYLWGFPMDKNYHKYWFEVPGCTCPKLDNHDMIGSSRAVFNMTCPFHGIGDNK